MAADEALRENKSNWGKGGGDEREVKNVKYRER